MMTVLALENVVMMMALASVKSDTLEVNVMNVTMDTMQQILQMEKSHVQVQLLSKLNLIKLFLLLAVSSFF